MAGLGPLVANSYGAQRGRVAEFQAAPLEVGAAESERLAAAMLARRITLCADETFLKDGIWLVAVEPVSEFVALEDLAKRRPPAERRALVGGAPRLRSAAPRAFTTDTEAQLLRIASLCAARGAKTFHRFKLRKDVEWPKR